MFHAVLSIAFAAYLLAIVIGIHQPDVADPVKAMWSVTFVGLVALAYTALQGLFAIRCAFGSAGRPFLGFVMSFLPLFVVVYAVAVWQYSPDKLSTYQFVSLVLGGAASVIDVFMFSVLSFSMSGTSLSRARTR